MNSSERIKHLRKNILDKTQEAFALELGLSRANIANIENDRIALTDRTLKDICERFNVNKEWILSGEGEIFAPSTKSEEIANFASQIINDENAKFKRRLVLALSQLSDDQWDAIEAVIDKIIEQED